MYDDPDEVWMLEDEIHVPVLTTPADGASSERVEGVTLGWERVTNATHYYVWVDIDAGFSDPDQYEVTSTSNRVTNLDPGVTYYWRVSTQEGYKAISWWSDTWSFTTALAVGQWNPFVGGIPEAPYNGATNVPLRPTFAWNAADWATGYEFLLADNPAYNPIVSKTGANALTGTVYECEVELDYATTYYWKVRAISKTSQSEWAEAVFTTISAPPPPPEAPPPPEKPEPPKTPAYIWVIIGVGAALVIAVIVLIVRTRARA
jgi:hypothetical protein